MVFVADDLTSWLIGLLADAGRKKLVTLVLGSEQDRALQQAATAAVERTARDLCQDEDRARHLALVIGQVFGERAAPRAPSDLHDTLLEQLQAGISTQLAVLDDVSLTGTGQSSSDVLGISSGVIAARLTTRMLQEIISAGAQGGPLSGLASQLNHDRTHLLAKRTFLQSERVEGKVDRLQDLLMELLTTASDGSPGQAELGMPIPRQLPPDDAHFTGRGRYLVQLDELLERSRGKHATALVITAIAGTAGVGKTALAIHWAHRVQDQFIDGVLYANLRGYDAEGRKAEPGTILDDFLRDLGVPESRIRGHLESRIKLYRSQLHGRRVLIVLDNAADADQVRPLLPGSPTCHVLITSRSVLPGLGRDGAERVTLDVMSPARALALLRQIIGAKAVDAERAEAGILARQCAYLPLALRIAAERAVTRPSGTLAELVAELTDERARLNMGTTDDPAMAVRAVFSWSYNVLSRESARLFRFLGLHSGLDISIPAASALAGIPTREGRELLEGLARVHLLNEYQPGRYQFHDLLRLYARDRAESDDTVEERAAAVRRLLDWYLHTASSADRVLIPYHRHVPVGALEAPADPMQFTSYDAAMQWCEIERGNLVAATVLAANDGEQVIAWKLPVALWSFFTLRRFWRDWIATHDVALACAQKLRDPFGEAWTTTNLGIAYRQLGKHDLALEHYRTALGIWTDVHDLWGQARIFNEYGEAYQELRQPDEAVIWYNRALPIWRQISDPWGEASTLTGLSNVDRALNLREDAIAHARSAIEVWESINDRRGQGRALSQIGEVCQEQGQHDEAIKYLEQALTIRRVLGERWGEARTLYTLGESLKEIGQPNAAGNAWNQALSIFDELEDQLADEVRIHLEALHAGETGPAGQPA
jgi:tetratricopeptide (TPR) repeat protein